MSFALLEETGVAARVHYEFECALCAARAIVKDDLALFIRCLNSNAPIFIPSCHSKT